MVLVVAPASARDTLALRLTSLAAEHGFQLQGLDKLGDAPAPRAGGDLTATLRTLLAGYDYVVDGTPPSVRRVIIVGARVPTPRGMVVPTTRQQGHHLVDATLEGAAGRRLTVALVVDTGASSVVLPASLMPALGFGDAELHRQSSQTVNGVIEGSAARLASVALGGAVARDVAVLFVPDERLGGTSLLGLSFLDHFSMTINDATGALVLTPR